MLSSLMKHYQTNDCQTKSTPGKTHVEGNSINLLPQTRRRSILGPSSQILRRHGKIFEQLLSAGTNSWRLCDHELIHDLFRSVLHALQQLAEDLCEIHA